MKTLTVLLLSVIVAGCRPQPALEFAASPAVVALAEEATDEEEKQTAQQLQELIAQKLDELCGTPQKIKLLTDPTADAVHLQRGAAVYQRRCVQCHGVNGDGNGPVGKYLYPLPRDYTKGIFKFTSTPWGSKPRRSDLVRTLRMGISGTAMPAFDRLSHADLEAVVDYVIALSQRGELEGELAYIAADEGELDDELIEEAVDKVVTSWNEAESQLVLPVSRMPEMTDESVAQGRELFLKQACNKCHGTDGRGGFFGNVEVTPDSWGHKTAAADLTSGMFHGGGRPIDIYRRIYTGINGTPMPGFANTFQQNPEAIWHLVHFIKDTGERRRRNLPPYQFAEQAAGAGNGDAVDEADGDDDGQNDDEADAS